MSDLGKQGGSIPANVKPPCEAGYPVDTGKKDKPGGDEGVASGFVPPLGQGNNVKPR